MYELKKSEEINRLIAITKSDSGISGPELAKAHIKLGMAMGRQIMGLSPEDTTIVAMLRGGIFFAEGMYFAMGVGSRHMILNMNGLSDQKQRMLFL